MPQNNAENVNVTKCLGTCCRGGEPILTGLATLGLAAKRRTKAHLSAEQSFQIYNLISPSDIPPSLTDMDDGPAPTEPPAPTPRRRRTGKKVRRKTAKKRSRR